MRLRMAVKFDPRRVWFGVDWDRDSVMTFDQERGRMFLPPCFRGTAVSIIGRGAVKTHEERLSLSICVLPLLPLTVEILWPVSSP